MKVTAGLRCPAALVHGVKALAVRVLVVTVNSPGADFAVADRAGQVDLQRRSLRRCFLYYWLAKYLLAVAVDAVGAYSTNFDFPKETMAPVTRKTALYRHPVQLPILEGLMLIPLALMR